jgi:hypothetical protein
MRMTGNWAVLAGAMIAVSLLEMACSTGPRPPQPGTPAFYWGAANEMFRIGNYLKTNDNLSQVTRSDNEFTARAQPFELVVASGLAQGYIDLAENYEIGARMNRANPTPFRKQVNLFRGYASNTCMQFAEAFHHFHAANKNATAPVALDFSYPTGSAAMPVQIKRVTSGIFVPEAEMESIQQAMLQREVLLSAARAVGAEDDTAKALEIFGKGNVQVPVPVFYMAMAKSLYDESQLFGPTKLDQPARLKLLCNEALEAIKLVPASKETKALSAKIEKALKKAGTT